MAYHGGQVSGDFPDDIRLNAVLRFHPVLLIATADQTEDLVEKADNRICEKPADHHRNRTEFEMDPVVHPVSVIKQEELAV